MLGLSIKHVLLGVRGISSLKNQTSNLGQKSTKLGLPNWCSSPNSFVGGFFMTSFLGGQLDLTIDMQSWNKPGNSMELNKIHWYKSD